MSVDRQDEATARAVEMFTHWVKSNDLDALLAAYARGEITDERIINELKNIGCDTARSVLDIPAEDLVKRTDLEEETIAEVLRILKTELEA